MIESRLFSTNFLCPSLHNDKNPQQYHMLHNINLSQFTKTKGTSPALGATSLRSLFHSWLDIQVISHIKLPVSHTMWTESDPYPFGAWIKTDSHPPDEQAMDVKDAGYVSLKATCYGKSIGTHRHTSLASYLVHCLYMGMSRKGIGTHWHTSLARYLVHHL
jgi:hypothetical protein